MKKMSYANKILAMIKEVETRIKADPSYGGYLLVKAGIYTKKGNLRKKYR